MIEELGFQLQSGEMGGIAVLFYTFVAGLLTSLTPCVYPLIPVTLSIFGNQSEASARRRLLSASVYCGGIVATYTLLGMVSAQTGMLFGSLLGHPLVLAGICFVLLALSLSMLDVFQLPGLQQIQGRANTVSGRSFRSLFAMGAVSGLVAAPCVSPVLAGVLIVAARGQNVLWGGLLLFVYALGISCIFLLLATFAGLIHRIPRSGNWLFGVKFFIASALICVILWLLEPILAPGYAQIHQYISPVWLTATILVILLLAVQAYRRNSEALKIVAALGLALAVYLLIFQGAPRQTAESADTSVAQAWFDSSSAALSAGASRNQITMIDIYADWCAACKELEHHTFPAPAVRKALENIVTARVDYAEEARLIEQFNVFGLPCILFLDPDGTEIPDSRIDGFIPPDAFARHIASVKQSFAKRHLQATVKD